MRSLQLFPSYNMLFRVSIYEIMSWGKKTKKKSIAVRTINLLLFLSFPLFWILFPHSFGNRGWRDILICVHRSVFQLLFFLLLYIFNLFFILSFCPIVSPPAEEINYAFRRTLTCTTWHKGNSANNRKKIIRWKKSELLSVPFFFLVLLFNGEDDEKLVNSKSLKNENIDIF